jgi:hypothetical protein
MLLKLLNVLARLSLLGMVGATASIPLSWLGHNQYFINFALSCDLFFICVVLLIFLYLGKKAQREEARARLETARARGRRFDLRLWVHHTHLHIDGKN